MPIIKDGDFYWVIGARGFIGSNLVKYLLELNKKVIGFIREGQNPSSKDKNYIEVEFTKDNIGKLAKSFGAPIKIFHFIGSPTVSFAFNNPLVDFENTAITTAILLDALRLESINSHIIFASSAAVYGNVSIDKINTSTALNSSTTYGINKVIAERLCQNFSRNYGATITILRFFSVYGPGLKKQIFYDIASKLERDKNVLELGGTGKEVRDFIHINDIVKLCYNLNDPSNGSFNIFNIGNGKGISIQDLANKFIRFWGKDIRVSFSGKSRIGDPFCLVANPDSFPPHFKPSIKIDQGIKSYVEWFKKK